MATQAQIAAVQQLYVGYLGRAADQAGLNFWADAIANGTATIKSVATGFTLSTEYKAAYAGLTSDALVDQVYNNVLGRAADAEGKAFWVAALAKGTVTADTLVATIVTNLGALDQATISNKVFVAQTYTDTVGAAYNPTAGADVLVGVDSTPASVTTALSAISSGSLAGQVPGLALINAFEAATTAQTAYEVANTATADALVAKLAALTNTLDDGDDLATQTDGITSESSYSAKIAAVVADATTYRSIAGQGESDTTVLATRAVTADTALTTAFNALTSAQKTLANTYKADIAAEATAKTAQATLIEKAGVIASLDADTSADAAFGAHGIGATATSLYSEYVEATAAERTAIDTEFKDSSFYATFKVSAVKDAAYADAQKATISAADVLDNSEAGDTYISALGTKTAADTLVTAAKAADADVATAKALEAAYAIKTDAVETAGTAVGAFNSAHTGVSVISPLFGGNTIATDAKDTFFFADKAVLTASTDFAVGSFGAGDSIVLGSGFTFNSGALSTGNNSATEFFLVKSDAGVQIVAENAAYGSADNTVNATSGAITASPHATVITLTGVTADHLSVANGVVSYV
jgi:hypothetical protein